MKKILISLLFAASCVGDGGNVYRTGAPCEAADECEGGTCLTATQDGVVQFEGGMCSAECDGLAGGGCIEGEEHCLTYIATEESHCYQACEYDGPDDQCRDGYRCLSVAFLTFACMPPTPSHPGEE